MARLLSLLAIVALVPARGRAEEALDGLAALHRACREAEAPGPRKLYSVIVPRPRFEGYDPADGTLRLDTRRNLRVLGGAAEIFPSGLETIGFRATEERAEELRRRTRKVRLGFFLGFDGGRQPCVIRSAVAVTTVRADLAYAELLDERGRVLAREDTERFRAWQDDAERYGLPGEGPRAAVVGATVDGAPAPPAWTQRLGAEAVRAGLTACWRQAIARQGPRDAQMIVRGRVGPGGRVVAEVELSSLGDDDAEACVLRVVSELPLPGPARFRLPVRFER